MKIGLCVECGFFLCSISLLLCFVSLVRNCRWGVAYSVSDQCGLKSSESQDRQGAALHQAWLCLGTKEGGVTQFCSKNSLERV